MFHYLGNERLQLCFFSPNVCATFLAMSVLLCIGFFWFLFDQKKIGWKIVEWGIVFPFILLQFIMLATTYSRGGYVACSFALLVACIFSRKKWSFLFPVLWGIILFLTGDGVERVQSIGNVVDGSIRNRLLLWEGGTGIIANYWLSGLRELSKVGLFYTHYYQPLWLNEGYLTLISDYLTIAAQYGIFFLFLILAFLLFLLQQGGQLYRNDQNPLLLYACAAVLSYMGASFFSTCYRFGNVTWLFCVAVLIIVFFVGRAALHHRIVWKHWSFWPAPMLAAVTCITILAYGVWVNASLPYTWKHGVTSPQSGSVRTLTFFPQEKGNDFHALLLTPDLEKAIRPSLRPLVSAGFTVTALEIEAGINGLKQAEVAVQELIASPNNKHFILFGSGEEQAVQTIALATRMEPGVITAASVVDAPFDWPFDELSPRLNVAKCRIPLFLLFHADKREENLALSKIAQTSLREVPISMDRWTTNEELTGKCLFQFLTGELTCED